MALALNSANDIFTKSGKIKRVTRGAQVVQDCRSRLLSYLGEWFLNTSYGVPYFEKVFVKPADLGVIETLLKNTITETPGVESLSNFEMTFDRTHRLLSVSFTAFTTFGDAERATINLPLSNSGPWILDGGFWQDINFWLDRAKWRDAP